MDLGTALRAIGAATIAALVAGFGSRLRGHDEPGYRWLQWWAPREHRVTVVIVTASHALVGAGATGVAIALGWYPLGESLWFLNALIYAGIGEALLRSDWADFFLDAATPTNSLLHSLLRERQANLRDTVAQRHLPIFLSKLDDTTLLQLVTKLIHQRFEDADEITLASKVPLITALNIAGAALAGRLPDDEGGAVIHAVRDGPVEQSRRDALAWLMTTASREIQAAEYRVPGFPDVEKALESVGKDLEPGPELLR